MAASYVHINRYLYFSRVSLMASNQGSTLGIRTLGSPIRLHIHTSKLVLYGYLSQFYGNWNWTFKKQKSHHKLETTVDRSNLSLSFECLWRLLASSLTLQVTNTYCLHSLFYGYLKQFLKPCNVFNLSVILFMLHDPRGFLVTTNVHIFLLFLSHFLPLTLCQVLS